MRCKSVRKFLRNLLETRVDPPPFFFRPFQGVAPNASRCPLSASERVRPSPDFFPLASKRQSRCQSNRDTDSADGREFLMPFEDDFFFLQISLRERPPLGRLCFFLLAVSVDNSLIFSSSSVVSFCFPCLPGGTQSSPSPLRKCTGR